MAILKGTAYWMHIADVNTGGKYPSSKYELVLGNLDTDAIAKVKAMGMGDGIVDGVATGKPEQGMFIKMKNKNRPSLITPDKEEYPVDTLVGNGSAVRAQVGTYTTANGTYFDWTRTMIDELVPYGGNIASADEFDEDEDTAVDDPYAVEE